MKIEEIEKVHSIGYRLKDAKVTINQDFKYNVAGVKIEGTQGDTNNMPQWIGKILNDSGVGTIDMPDMITELKQALSKEKMVGEYQLSTLESHFYIKLKQSMKELNRDDFDKVESILLELFRMRRGKIVKLADSIKLNSDIYNQLTVEENIFYKTIYDNSKEFERASPQRGSPQRWQLLVLPLHCGPNRCAVDEWKDLAGSLQIAHDLQRDRSIQGRCPKFLFR